MILPRLATWLEAEDCLFVKSRIIVRLFVWADVVTFWVQASGGGLTAMESLANIGTWVRVDSRAAQHVIRLVNGSRYLTDYVRSPSSVLSFKLVASSPLRFSASFLGCECKLLFRKGRRKVFGSLAAGPGIHKGGRQPVPSPAVGNSLPL